MNHYLDTDSSHTMLQCWHVGTLLNMLCVFTAQLLHMWKADTAYYYFHLGRWHPSMFVLLVAIRHRYYQHGWPQADFCLGENAPMSCDWRKKECASRPIRIPNVQFFHGAYQTLHVGFAWQIYQMFSAIY